MCIFIIVNKYYIGIVADRSNWQFDIRPLFSSLVAALQSAYILYRKQKQSNKPLLYAFVAHTFVSCSRLALLVLHWRRPGWMSLAVRSLAPSGSLTLGHESNFLTGAPAGIVSPSRMNSHTGRHDTAWCAQHPARTHAQDSNPVMFVTTELFATVCKDAAWKSDRFVPPALPADASAIHVLMRWMRNNRVDSRSNSNTNIRLLRWVWLALIGRNQLNQSMRLIQRQHSLFVSKLSDCQTGWVTGWSVLSAAVLAPDIHFGDVDRAGSSNTVSGTNCQLCVPFVNGELASQPIEQAASGIVTGWDSVDWIDDYISRRFCYSHLRAVRQ